MAEYIEREKAIKKFENYCADCEDEGDIRTAQVFEDCVYELRDIPAADVATVVHRKRLKEVYRDSYGADWTRYVCRLFGRVEIKKEPYCNCGAKMDGGGKANE